MTGGGFGGCTVNLVAPEAVAAFEAGVREAYQARFGIVPADLPLQTFGRRLRSRVAYSQYSQRPASRT